MSISKMQEANQPGKSQGFIKRSNEATADCREKQETEVVNASRLSGEAGLQNCFQCVLLSCFIGKKGISSNDLVVKASITFTSWF